MLLLSKTTTQYGYTGRHCAYIPREQSFITLPIMAVHSFTPKSAGASFFVACLLCLQYVSAQTGSVYRLDSEYSGVNFFDGWDFYTVGAILLQDYT